MTYAVTVRSTQPEDIPVLSEYWYDRVTLLQQSNPRIALAPDARQRWETVVTDWLTQPDMISLTAMREDEPIGVIIVTVIPNAPGLLPEKIAQILEIVIDIHTPHKQQGIGRYLLNALKVVLIEKNISHLQVSVSTTAVVEQAFWRGMGAKSYDEIFWMAL